GNRRAAGALGLAGGLLVGRHDHHRGRRDGRDLPQQRPRRRRLRAGGFAGAGRAGDTRYDLRELRCNRSRIRDVAAVPTTWNPSDKSSGIALSNGNLTATNTDNNVDGGRAIASATAGKAYFKITCTRFTYSLDAVGICNSSYALGSIGNPSGGGVGKCTVKQLGTVWLDGGSVGPVFGGVTNGTVMCIAVDLTAKLMWFRKGAAALWNVSGTADPATGTGGISIPNLGGSVAAYPTVSLGNTNDAATANFGPTAFAGTVPSG